jgi:hypothetical protein
VILLYSRGSHLNFGTTMFKEESGSAGLPPELVTAHKGLVQIPSAVEKFRGYLQFIPAAKSVLKGIEQRIRERQRAVRALEGEMQFIARPRTRIETLLRACAGTFASPGKALAAVDQLAKGYTPTYVLEVAKLGSGRLTRPRGLDVFGIKNPDRLAAEENYQKVVIPAMAGMLNDHRVYLDMGGQDLVTQLEDLNDEMAKLNRDKMAMGGAMRQSNEELLVLARSMSPEELAQLDERERQERQWLLPETMRDPPPVPAEAEDSA